MEKMKPFKNDILTASILGALAVILGAFGAHALEPFLIENGNLTTYKTGNQYHFYFTIFLFLVALINRSYPSAYFRWAKILMLTGIIFFSGSLYMLAIADVKIMGAVAPLGGLSFIVSFVLVAMGVMRISDTDY